LFRNVSLVAALTATALVAAACGGSNNNSGGGGGGGSSASVPNVTPASFTNDFSTMSKFKALAKEGKGKIAVILPDTTTSARYTEFDAPYLKKSSSWPA
jgi:D-xylose transport system substrate-binding protein